MCIPEKNVSLGFVEQSIPMGSHVCLIYTDEIKRFNSLKKFVLSGLKNKERIACFSDLVSSEMLSEYLGEQDISYQEITTDLSLSMEKTTDQYLIDGTFDPEMMLQKLKKFYTDSKAYGFKSVRIIGEMLPDIKNYPGGERLMEYESRVSLLQREYPITAVCQYDANRFDGATIMDILRVHPYTVINGSVVRNPYFVEPESYLSQN